MRKEAKIALASIVNVFLILIVISIVFLLTNINATSSGSNGNANLTIYDERDLNGLLTKISNDNYTFYSNYTNISNSAINSTNGVGNCQVSFNFTGAFSSFTNMSFNSTNLIWFYNRSFNYKGTHNFQVNCTSTFGNITLNDTYLIDNSAPRITKTSGNTFIDLDNTLNTFDYYSCFEDTLCLYNFTANITEPDLNDILTFENLSTNTTLTNFTFNSANGILTINVTIDGDSGSKQINLRVTDSDSGTDSAILRLNISAVNDLPQFLNLGGNRTINKSLFDLILTASDEENDLNLTFNVTFMQCSFTSLNPPTGPNNCTLFNLTNYNATSTNISFIPSGNQKGEYKINFSVKDSRNASYSQVVNWTLTWNDKPFFTYVCDNSRNTSENSPFSCYINASDSDELYNLTFTTNYTWFKFNNTGTNSSNHSTIGGNASTIINFTATDLEVGNWSINITVIDTGATNSSIESNSTLIYFFIANVNDSVSLLNISDLFAYDTNNYTIYSNASDNDLLIPDKMVYNESLTFTSNNSNVLINSTNYISGTNTTIATIKFNPALMGLGNHTVNISVADANNYSISSDTFTIQIFSNNIPQWNSSTQNNHSLNENSYFYLNLSQNVSDVDNQQINFSFSNVSIFPSFNINITTGIINFTPLDADVGQHIIIINATDGVNPASLTFNFTIYNVNDTPSIQFFPSSGSYNSSGNSTFGLINVTEDNNVRLKLWVHDDDFRIPSGQKTFYNENLSINLTIQGPNVTLFSFVIGSNWFDTIQFPQRAEFNADFIPLDGDVGNYNITINITDNSSLSTYIFFNLSVNRINDAPTLTNLGNIITSIIESIYVNYNASDEEDINESNPGSNLTFSIVNLSSGGNFLNQTNFNRSTGVLNFTFSQAYAGFWMYNISVNDSSGLIDYELINITVYDYPVILSPLSNIQFNLKENDSYQFNFSVNNTVGYILNETLNYTLIINGLIRNSTNGNGNSTRFLWNYTANFTDETTCLGVINLTLNVSNLKLSNSTTWNLTINHTNAPLSFINNINNINGGTPQTITLSSIYRDIDASDYCVNQTIGFIASLISGTGISTTISNWTNSINPSIQFSATSDATANYSIIAYEYNGSNYTLPYLSNQSSNNFSVILSVSTTTVQTPSSGGGGGGGSSSTEKLISLKIIVPEPVSAKRKDKLIIPLGIWNDGEVDLNEIVLSSLIAKDGFLRNDLIASFDKSFIPSLKAGERVNVTMIVDIDTTVAGLFEVTINGSVKNPEYNDWAKFYIEIDEDEDILEKIIFTEELLIGNPECAELQGLIDEAKDLFNSGDIILTKIKLDEVIQSCKRLISQPITRKAVRNIQENLFAYISIASIIALGLGFGYYQIKKIQLKQESTKINLPQKSDNLYQ